MTAHILRLERQPARPTLFGNPLAAQFLECCQSDERSQAFPDERQDPLGPVGQLVAEGGEKAEVEPEVRKVGSAMNMLPGARMTSRMLSLSERCGSSHSR